MNDPKPKQSPLFDLMGQTVTGFSIEDMTADDYAGPAFVANFDPSDDKYIQLAFKSQQKTRVDPDAPAAKKFPVSHWCVERHMRFRDDQGAKSLGVTLSLFDPEGNSLIVTSDVVLRFWNMALGMRGTGPWKPPIHVCLEKVKSGQGRTMIQLSLVGK